MDPRESPITSTLLFMVDNYGCRYLTVPPHRTPLPGEDWESPTFQHRRTLER